MRRAGEFGIAAGLAVGLHLAAFAALGSGVPAGVESAGDGGEALVSLMPSDAGIAALVDRWERPPVVDMSEIAPSPQPKVEAVPEMNLPQLAVPEPEPPALPTPALQALSPVETLPDLAALAPPPKPEPAPEPEREVQPEAEPEAEPAPAAKPAPAKPAPAEPQQGQVAAGEGEGKAAGKSGTAQAATASGAGAEALRAEWGAEIRARIERRKSYPRDGDGAAGTVKLRIVMGADGRLRGVAVVSSSGSQALDAAAVRAVERAGRFPRAPKGLGVDEVSFTLPISFRP